MSLNKYISSDSKKSENTSTKQVSSESNVDKLFQENMKKQIKKELNSNGYDSNKILITTDENYNVSSIHISEVFEYKENKSSINEVKIDIKEKPAKGIAYSDKQKLIEYFSENYKIEKDKITID